MRSKKNFVENFFHFNIYGNFSTENLHAENTTDIFIGKGKSVYMVLFKCESFHRKYQRYLNSKR